MLEPKLKEKSWTKELETPIYKSWKDKQVYKFNEKSKKPLFSIDTPPPYVNAPIHIGQATTYILMDMFARFRRMTGHEVIFPLGLDRNGLPIEVAAEKKFNIKLSSLPRQEAIEKCKTILEESSSESTDTFLKLGISFNSWKKGNHIGAVYETDSPEYRTLTQDTFIDLWHKGLVYEDERISNFCPGCQTPIADSEVEYKDIQTFFNDVIFMVKETGEKIIIGTTRPELISTCGMIIFNPEDKRYHHLKGKTAITPIYHKEVPIQPHPLAQIDKGTGLVMMCSAGDLSDIRFFREMNLQPIIAIEKDGRMNKLSGLLEGLAVKEARKKIIETLKEKKLLTTQKQIMHRTPVCERSKDPIEFIAMKEFYIKQMEFKEDIKKIANKINFYSPRSKQILSDWINSISTDWPVSRRRVYATEIPLWYCDSCSHVIVPEKGQYHQPWKNPPKIKACPKCKSAKFKGETRVFDTWMDSAVSPLYILGYNNNKNFFKKATPCSLRPQGKEIVRTWLYYTLLRCYFATNKPIFKDVWINYHIVDETGRKMSKSIGNIIDPQDAIKRFGAEPFRLWAAVEGNLEETDFRCSFERIEGAGKSINKLWNVARFISMFPKVKKPSKLEALDLWIIKELNSLVIYSKERYEHYDFHNPSTKIKHFLWETFASHYLELVKSRAYNQNKIFTKEEENSARFTLHYCLGVMLKLLAPITPLITHKIYNELEGKDIHQETFPLAIKINKQEFTTEKLVELNSTIWKAKKDKGLSLKEEISKAVIPKEFKSLEKDLKAAHNIKEISFNKELKLQFKE